MNTFQHVVDCLRRIIPGVSEEKAWDLAHRIDGQGSAEVWCGPSNKPSSTTSSSPQRVSPWLPWSVADHAAGFRLERVSRRRSTVRKRRV